ncbi:staphylopine uptake ABC transporter ATP-binding protein CntD [Paenibacillus gansuensis]|uniref:Staphylopine uptake ABC transporter ATP-binding protein CntD n=1 Tax=Paenibacillus gansuensis TaxID=306542 RepID=A0ABW5PB29_9BACL
MAMLEVSNLRIWDSRTGSVMVPGSSFQVGKGSCLGIVGESGSGKSLTCRAIMRLNKPGIRQSGDILFNGVNLAQLSEKNMRPRRGKQLYMIMQNGMRAFDPSCLIGVHLREVLSGHFGWGREEITIRMKCAMSSVLLKDPIAVMNSYPHQLSGGMLQRVMIALALVLEPDLIIADEFTSALDTLSRFEVMEQFMQLRQRMGCSVMFVSHDLGVVQKLADEILVMKDGMIVERGTTEAIFSGAMHEYTRQLVSSSLALHHRFQAVTGGMQHVERERRREVL